MEEITLNKSFYNSSLKILKNLKKTKLKEIPIPKYKLLLGGEKYFDNLFKIIDNAQKQIWIVNYTLDESEIGNVYLRKLINAQERGVKCNLFIDNLLSNPNKKLLDEFQEEGGKVYYRNAKEYIWNQIFRTYFQRDHEKICLADNKIILGSSNIGEEYGGKKYGNNFFLDMNIYLENCCLKDTIIFFDIMLKDLGVENNFFEFIPKKDYVNDYIKIFPDSPFCEKINLLRTFFPWVEEIQNNLIGRIKNAKKEIKIINPYYYPIPELDSELIKAQKRGVKITLITSKERDVPVYKYFQNSVLFKNYIKNGIKIYEYFPQYLHAKCLCIDNEFVNIGSFNFDTWSWEVNNEINVEIGGDKVLLESFEENWSILMGGSRVVEVKEDYDTRYERFLVWASKYVILKSHQVSKMRRYYKKFKKIKVYKYKY